MLRCGVMLGSPTVFHGSPSKGSAEPRALDGVFIGLHPNGGLRPLHGRAAAVDGAVVRERRHLRARACGLRAPGATLSGRTLIAHALACCE